MGREPKERIQVALLSFESLQFTAQASTCISAEFTRVTKLEVVHLIWGLMLHAELLDLCTLLHMESFDIKAELPRKYKLCFDR